MIEHMIKNKWRERRAKALLEWRAREAMHDRGELGEDGDGGKMADAGGDNPDGPPMDCQRWGAHNRDALPLWRFPSFTTATKDEDIAEVVHSNKWSLANAVLL